MAWQMTVSQFRIIAITPSGFTENRTLSPAAAARRDPDSLIALFHAIKPHVNKIQAQRQREAQLDLFPDTPL